MLLIFSGAYGNSVIQRGNRDMGVPFIKNDPRINRKGRPKKGQSLTDILDYNLDMKNKDGVLYRDGVAKKLIQLALSGDVAAIKYIMDRIDGRPAETIKASVQNSFIDITAIEKKLEAALLEPGSD